MVMTPEIALNQIARRCSREMIAVGTKNQRAHKSILDTYEQLVKQLNYSRIQLMSEIGRVNGQLRER